MALGTVEKSGTPQTGPATAGCRLGGVLWRKDESLIWSPEPSLSWLAFRSPHDWHWCLGRPCRRYFGIWNKPPPASVAGWTAKTILIVVFTAGAMVFFARKCGRQCGGYRVVCDGFWRGSPQSGLSAATQDTSVDDLRIHVGVLSGLVERLKMGAEETADQVATMPTAKQHADLAERFTKLEDAVARLSKEASDRAEYERMRRADDHQFMDHAIQQSTLAALDELIASAPPNYGEADFSEETRKEADEFLDGLQSRIPKNGGREHRLSSLMMSAEHEAERRLETTPSDQSMSNVDLLAFRKQAIANARLFYACALLRKERAEVLQKIVHQRLTLCEIYLRRST